MKGLKRFIEQESGLETLEYAVMTAIVAAAAVVAVTALAAAFESRYAETETVLEGVG